MSERASQTGLPNHAASRRKLVKLLAASPLLALAYQGLPGAWQEALALALRFARQLQVDATHTHRTPAPNRAKGGLKSTPWSNQSRTSDSALALLLGTEVLREATADVPGPEAEAAPTIPTSPRTQPQ